ncbi:MAG: peptide chain release factor N(5)-glutamine methyltransferase [Planctomycetota bacterium]|nr:MAG: peptide chain release factor N(5)-glutamine methyltransferase [Planctomycetota bacterium]
MTEGGRINAAEETWTIRKVLEWTTAFFEKNGIDSPRLDAEVLLAHSLGVERIKLYMEIDRPLAEAERAPLRALVKRRAAREPAAYLVGEKEFYSLAFEVNENVLVPRPDTEFLVDAVLDRTGRGDAFTFVDVGTGSGCIAAAIAVNRPKASGLAVDVNPGAVEVAKRNFERHGLANRVKAVCGNLLEPAIAHFGGRKIDAVVSNPPYVTEEEFEKLEPEIRDHEPRSALLDIAEDGLGSFRAIADAAADLLSPGALFVCELGAGQYGSAAEFLASGPWTDVSAVRDYGGVDRVIVAGRK